MLKLESLNMRLRLKERNTILDYDDLKWKMRVPQINLQIPNKKNLF